ncbi:hypothetical protein BC937DRAFT_86609 [Endogone sp. FLAS-F59071]|nr:hypothetical protein BC937DRAFT_86609 [Endogone sp. FLAS-F59071]|eukprot:RUS19986.1 hypothetical protein BC937DRAFT_86609 [Endogone sp. FLAS-F59071]
MSSPGIIPYLSFRSAPLAVHISIHTVWRFSPEVAAEFEKELQKLGSKTGTSVSFDQETQCFELIGKSHEELDSVWPQLQSGIRKLTKLKEKKFDGSAAATPTSERQSTANYSPKQVPSSETFANDSNSNGHNNTLADIIGGTSPVARAEIQPSGPASTFESRDFPPSSPSMVPAPLEIDDTVDEMPVSMAFTFSDEVDDLTQVIGSYLGQNIDFLIDICRETYTFFIINGKV